MTETTDVKRNEGCGRIYHECDHTSTCYIADECKHETAVYGHYLR